MIEKFSSSTDRLLWFKDLGSSYSSQGDYDQAVALYTQALKEFADKPDLHISLGWALYERGDGVEIAQKEFEKAIELGKQSGEGYFAVGQLLNREEDFIEAEEWLRQAVNYDPEKKWYAIVLGNTLRSSGDFESAVEVYEQIITEYPDYDRGYLELAQVYYLLNRNDEAKSAIEKAIEHASSLTEWYFIRAGRIYEQAGENEKALQYYYQALGIDPTNTTALQSVDLLEN
jgi:tetratricopeptide (TPR) repeat protein